MPQNQEKIILSCPDVQIVTKFLMYILETKERLDL